MSILYSLDPSKGNAFVVWDRVVTADDWAQSVNAFLAEPELHRIHRVITDARYVSDNSSITQADTEQITRVFAGVKQPGSNIKFAVVTTNTSGQTGKAEHLLRKLGVSVMTFNHLDTACTYLGIPLQEARRTLEELRARLRSRGNP